nr:hypothetical protein BaRGS_023120 [Batillaria attramentaria]
MRRKRVSAEDLSCLEGVYSCSRVESYMICFLVQIAAIALIAVGAYVQVKLVDYYDFFGNSYSGPGILLIVVGVLIFIIAFFGCMGALKENYCLTMTFAVLLGIIFIMMIAGGIAAYVLQDDWAKVKEEDVSKGLSVLTPSGPVQPCLAVMLGPNGSRVWSGCEQAFVSWMEDNVAIIGGVGIGLAFIMVVGVLFACCLARAIRKEYEVV